MWRASLKGPSSALIVGVFASFARLTLLCSRKFRPTPGRARGPAAPPPGRPAALDDDPVDMGLGDDGQVCTAAHRIEIGARRRTALAVLLRREDAIDAALAAVAIIVEIGRA